MTEEQKAYLRKSEALQAAVRRLRGGCRIVHESAKALYFQNTAADLKVKCVDHCLGCRVDEALADIDKDLVRLD